jgi:hypothetical protein
MSIIPAHRPTLDAGLALMTCELAFLSDKNADGARIIRDTFVWILAVRFPKIGEYDDTIAAVTRDGELLAVCNGNTQPSRCGHSSTAPGKDMARLVPGVIPMIRGHHGDLPHCFRDPSPQQALVAGLQLYFKDARARGEQIVERMADAEHGKRDVGNFACNLHPGGNHGTSSAGCLTIPQPQYDELRDAVYHYMDREHQVWLPVVLVEGPI